MQPVPFSIIREQALADRANGTQRISLRIVQLAISRKPNPHGLVAFAIADPAHWPAPDYGGQWIHGRLTIMQRTGA